MYFSQFGDVSDTVVVRDRETGESRGFAFVTFDHVDAVKRVFALTEHGGHMLDGTFVQVRRYFPKAGYCADKVWKPQTLLDCIMVGGCNFEKSKLVALRYVGG